MPIKGRFNGKGNMNENELEKQILRINALEVHIKRLLAFETQFRAYRYKTRGVEEEKHSRKNEADIQSQSDGRMKENVEINKEFHKRDKRLDEITRKLNGLEQIISDIIPPKHDSYSQCLSIEEAMVREERLQNLVEQLLSEKLVDRIKEEENIHMRVSALEQNLLLVNEVQAGLLKQVNDLFEKYNQLSQNKGEPEDLVLQQEPIFKTLYIDKLYLDKYEQNNNFAQLGIKQLSGALNIGATYGRDAIPKEVTEQVKEDIAKMKAVKEEMKEQQMNTDQSKDTQYDESSSDLSMIPPEEDIPYTEITIEEDSSFGEDPYNE